MFRLGGRIRVRGRIGGRSTVRVRVRVRNALGPTVNIIFQNNQALTLHLASCCKTAHSRCQLVALNYQTNSVEMQLNDAMFMRNARCGYVRLGLGGCKAGLCEIRARGVQGWAVSGWDCVESAVQLCREEMQGGAVI